MSARSPSKARNLESSRCIAIGDDPGLRDQLTCEFLSFQCRFNAGIYPVFGESLCESCIFIFNLVRIDQLDLSIPKALKFCVADKIVRDEFSFTSAMNLA
jgi:hypothetical protein